MAEGGTLMVGLRTRSQHAGILIAVLVVITIAALAGTSATYLAQSELQNASASQRRVQSRSLAWSGVQAAMSEMASQRQNLLLGGRPQLTQQWEMFDDPSGRRAVIRLVPGESGEVVTSELSRLDINKASEAMLEALGLEERLIRALVEARERRPFGSPAELLQVEGFTPAILFGEDWDQPGASGSRGGARSLMGEAEPRPLIENLTVFSFDPNVQNGIGPGGATHRGKLRINLNMGWSERLGSAIDGRFGPGTGEMARGLMEAGIKLDSLSVLIQGLGSNNADRRIWPIILDAFAMSDSLYIRGRVDLNVAPAEVLACIPGISMEAAEQIVQLRQSVSESDRRTILWPLLQGILTVEEMARAADHLTTRSMQWRLVVEGGFVPAGDRRSWQDLEEEDLQERTVLEVVIDVASERPRIAYLRDTTMLGVAKALAGSMYPFEEEDPYELMEERSEEGQILVEQQAQQPSLQDLMARFGNWQGGEVPDPSILEQALRGPIEVDAEGAETSESDERIGRWTPGPARRDSGR